MEQAFGICRISTLVLVMEMLIGISGALECMCTTDQCTKSNKMFCTAEMTCYVQIMHDSFEQVTGEYTKDAPYKVMRGCIDESMPLLCENRRPVGYTGPWPILHCCKEDWCNREILPTDPPWLIEDRLKYENQQKEDNYEDYGDNWESYRENGKRRKKNHHKSDSHSYEDSSHYNSDSKRLQFNILYIAAPIAGACVVLALVIFTLYLMKMNRRNVKHCVKSQQNHISSIYKQKLPLMVEVRDHQRYFHCAPVHQGRQYTLNQSCSSKVCQSKQCDLNKPRSCDQSHDHCNNSAGSETRLLM